MGTKNFGNIDGNNTSIDKTVELFMSNTETAKKEESKPAQKKTTKATPGYKASESVNIDDKPPIATNTKSGENEVTMPFSKELNEEIKEAAKKLNIEVHPGIVHSSDAFYTEEAAEQYVEAAKKAGATCCEMESFGLFHNAKIFT